jgi:hypothetical protein
VTTALLDGRTPEQIVADGHCERIAMLAAGAVGCGNCGANAAPGDTETLAFAHRVISIVEDVLAQWAIVQLTDGKMSGDHLASNLNHLRAVMDGVS